MLLQALVACAGVTLKAVAALEFRLQGGAVMAEGDLDFRGTLGVDKEAPVGFREIRLRFDLDTDEPAERIAMLQKLTERYCVVLQTIRGSPAFSFDVATTAGPAAGARAPLHHALRRTITADRERHRDRQRQQGPAERPRLDAPVESEADQLDGMGEVDGADLVRNRLDSRIFHSGYSADERKNIGKMTKFMTPAKFSSWRMVVDSSRPMAPSISRRRPEPEAR